MKFFKKPIIIFCTLAVLIVGLVFIYKTVSMNKNQTDIENAVEVKEKNNKANINDEKSSNNKPTTDNSKTGQNKEKDNETDVKNTIVEDEYIKYTIKEGDSLYSIIKSEMSWSLYNNGLKMLTEINNIRETDVLKIGSTILIPANNIDSTNCTSYIVNEGDTLYSIAMKYYPTMTAETAVNVIMDKNNIVNAKEITTGLEMYLPNEGIVSVNSSNLKDKNSNTKNSTNHSLTTDNEYKKSIPIN
ncbi:hypothetical protein SH2C18_08380 [Clostridium sediminicola]|uniref:LysM peptidoglycan-binding domain-containing protein n=1 Tax=Clostridium sediminicola TaxID=3114879 RepID=UPI0031F1F1AF